MEQKESDTIRIDRGTPHQDHTPSGASGEKIKLSTKKDRTMLMSVIVLRIERG
jgi:hypothetical protein